MRLGPILALLLTLLLTGCGSEPPTENYTEAEQAPPPPHLIRLEKATPDRWLARLDLTETGVLQLRLQNLSRPDTFPPRVDGLELFIRGEGRPGRLDTFGDWQRKPEHWELPLTTTRVLWGKPAEGEIPRFIMPDLIQSLEDLDGGISFTADGERFWGNLAHEHGSDSLTPIHRHEPPSPLRLYGLLLIYCLLVVAGSLAGGFLPTFLTLSHRRMQFIISCVAGLMLGIGVFHLLPHGLIELQSRSRPLGSHGGNVFPLADSRYAVERLPGTGFQVAFYHTGTQPWKTLKPEAAHLVQTAADGTIQKRTLLPLWQVQEEGPVYFLSDPLSAANREEIEVTLEGEKFTVPLLVPADNSINLAVGWLMGGLLGMFGLIRLFHFHHHGDPGREKLEVLPVLGQDHHHDHGHDHDHHHDHDHGHDHGHHYHDHAHQELGWVGVALGLALHTFIDGLALGASIQADAGHGAMAGLFGLGTFLAILLHKPLDAVSITSLMSKAGWSRKWMVAVNIGFALMCPLGALAFFLGLESFSNSQHLLIGCGLAASAGVFLCISLADLLPELEFHSHDRLKLTLCLLLGIALAWGIGYLEPEHAHQAGQQLHSH